MAAADQSNPARQVSSHLYRFAAWAAILFTLATLLGLAVPIPVRAASFSPLNRTAATAMTAGITTAPGCTARAATIRSASRPASAVRGRP
ncbi:MAG: hypothetical protein PSW75_02525 [bacterium]|nr:hypothetical protein [bacterium]MDI1337054.1 hypothetical protein [Lacunisphaera sp.]